MTIPMILVLGFVFGAILQRGRLNRFDTIAGMATLEDFTVAKALAVAIGVGLILLTVEIALGGAAYHVKPLLLGGIGLGGLVFGVGMALLGYCPGTLAVSLGEGSLDALAGVVGGLLGGLVYTLTLPAIGSLLGPNLGKLSLYSISGGATPLLFVLVTVAGLGLVWVAFRLAKAEPQRGRGWLYAGLALAALDVFTFSTVGAGRPIGASTAYPYFADVAAGATSGGYFQKIAGSGHWEFVFLGGALLAGLVLSLVSREFKLTLVHERWRGYHGASPAKRLAWATVGGFLLIYGARMAGGCTSGHILSGGMQGAISSWLFGVFVFAGLLATGKLFYRSARA